MKTVNRQVLVLSAMLVTIHLASCATQPRTVVINADTFKEGKTKLALLNSKRRAEYTLRNTQEFFRHKRQSYNPAFRNDLEIQMKAIRSAMQDNNLSGLGYKTNHLEDNLNLLESTLYLTEYLSSNIQLLNNVVSKSFIKELKTSLSEAQKAVNGTDWGVLKKTNMVLSELDEKVQYFKLYIDITSALDELGDMSKLSLSLKRQINTKLKPLRSALQRDSWEEARRIAENDPDLLSYPGRILDLIKTADQFEQMLQTGEKEYLHKLIEFRDTTLLGDSWEQALQASRDTVEKTEEEYGAIDEYGNSKHLGWAPCVKILTIDGGGVRGVIPARILMELEKRTGKKIPHMFDYIAGTSTGGILALGLVIPEKPGSLEPKFDSKELLDKYYKDSKIIFPKNPLRYIKLLVTSRYNPSGLEEVLKKYFGKNVMGDAIANVMVTSYELRTRKHVVFSNQGDTLYKMRDIARATSAAPTYFPPLRITITKDFIKNIGNNAWQQYEEKFGDIDLNLDFIDGGVFANNPSAIAINSIKQQERSGDTERFGEERPWLLVSIGTGEAPLKPDLDEDTQPENWNALKWLPNLIDILASKPGTNTQAKMGLGPDGYFYRLQPDTLSEESAKMDDASDKNLALLVAEAEKYIAMHSDSLDDIVKLLLREKPEECKPPILKSTMMR